jgi:hypothetical protein
MGSMRKQMLIQQKASFEQTLKERLAYLAGKEDKSLNPERDTIVRKLKADIKAVKNRVRTVTDIEKRTEEMARIKAEKAAAPKKEAEPAKAEKPKKGAEEGKAKKPKPEKSAKPKAEGPKEEAAPKAETKAKAEPKA